MEMSTPPSKPVNRGFSVSEAAAPGTNNVSCTKLRPLSGSSVICWLPIVFETSPERVSTKVAAAVTSMVSDGAPTSNTIGTTNSSATCRRMPALEVVLKPATLTVIV